MYTLLGVLGTQELIIIFALFIPIIIIPVFIAYRLGKKVGKREALAMQHK